MGRPAIQSGNALIDSLFQLCVALLDGIANLFGTSYYTVNVVIFCILWPLLTIALVVIVVRQRRRIRELSRALKSGDSDRI